MREDLVKIYLDTLDVCKDIVIPLTEKVSFDYNLKLIENNKKAGNIIVEPLDTVSALIKYNTLGKTCVLNMASAKRKGGGVEKGAMAQEECLFRSSNLYNISQDLYPIEQNEYIYTKDATFVKDFYYNLIEPITADVVTIPALNLNNPIDLENFGYTNDQCGYETITSDKIFFMLNAAIANGCENIILGAWGCGVFKNDPNIISELFKEILESTNIKSQFNNIVFAVINDTNSVDNNYEIFRKKFA